ncbi:hypothetical protein PoB_006113900 [Plakobranchus ocellatus]|uniref:Uncharacterized protein n=1 Tax=Plakobranchus ocellatus TaxID=259542 RepID=A0AAV4CS21_9GAST|nr:hypothetical protein PoB_006113900 [Plakobranchus ocellatus]
MRRLVWRRIASDSRAWLDPVEQNASWNDKVHSSELGIEPVTSRSEIKRSTDLATACSYNTWCVGGTVACGSALRSAGSLLSRVRAPPSAPRPDGGP